MFVIQKSIYYFVNIIIYKNKEWIDLPVGYNLLTLGLEGFSRILSMCLYPY